MNFTRFVRRLIGARARSDTGGATKREQGWSIGIYSGRSPFELAPDPACTNPVLTAAQVTDTEAMFVADPFMIRFEDLWYMFFELWNLKTKKGEIGLATSRDGREWRYERIVLAEPFHLSYPYVFEWDGVHYMIPETHQARSVRLYRARSFPLSWELDSVLLDGHSFADASPARYGGRWWMFVDTSPEKTHDTLRLYMAEQLKGPWREHPRSPIHAGDPRVSRPAGRVLETDGGLVRFTQDCYPTYGRQVHAFRTTVLTDTEYAEEPVGGTPIVGASGHGWNAAGMHQIDAHALDDGTWLACVDGFDWFERPVRARRRKAR